MLKIKDIRASVHEFEVTLPLDDLPGEKRKFMSIVFGEVETDDGTVGYGYTGPYLGHAVVAALRNEVLATVEGMDVRDVEALHHAVWWKLNERAMTGVVASALSVLDLACWDIHGKATGRTCAQLIGGARDWAPAYVTCGLAQFDRDQLAEECRRQVDRGFRRLKMIVAVDEGGWREDVRRVGAVRDAVGEDVEIMCDANYMFYPVEAKQFLRGVEDCNITWFEEPLYANDARAMNDLRRTSKAPIAAGQMEGHRWRLRELVEKQAVDILQLNAAYNGGFTEARKAAHLAQAYNLPIANGGGWRCINIHLQAGLMNGWRVEFNLYGTKFVEDLIFADAPTMDAAKNIARVNTAPGLGVTPDMVVLKDSRVEPA
jgi:L-alanine-DL-glutamate epimerase-like enolase superfamily enzyme